MQSLFMLLLGLALAPVANAGTSSETSCFTSGSTRPIRLELRLYHDSTRNWSAGFVKYEKSTKKIPLVAADRGRPPIRTVPAPGSKSRTTRPPGSTSFREKAQAWAFPAIC
ncbi:hypothetical protein [Variovorax sp. UC122_21]|uniref:hypothetical protein n=1 Tax=Variovorax sp. UC122_21 TaxID=3374554 RepID=UPI003757F2CB